MSAYIQGSPEGRDEYGCLIRKIPQVCQNSGIALAGGICSDNVKSYVELNPDIIIVGEGIVAHKDRREKAKLIKEIMAER